VRIMRTSRKRPIDWLFPETRKHTLTLLFGRPDERWYLRDIARRTGSALGSIQRELAGLVQSDILTQSKDGNRKYYQANRECPFFAELTGFFIKTSGLADIVKEVLKPLAKKIKVAFIYGSIAAGSAKSRSDVDLMVIGSCKFSEVVDAIHKAQEKIGREINPTVYSIKEWQEKLASSHHFVTTVNTSQKLFIIGGHDDMERLA
jgi:predicted nucleotidyltransferase